jgi:2-polyprenyl-6-methoxyphenol hydroxylase-like FAD-dependent oxidoreductase
MFTSDDATHTGSPIVEPLDPTLINPAERQGNPMSPEMGTTYDVLVAGAGPIGLMLALELRLAGVRVLVVERREEPDTVVKAEGINTASIEALDRRGLLPVVDAVVRRLFPEPPKTPGVARGDYAPFAGHFGGIQIPAGPVDRDDPLLRNRGQAGWYLQIPQVELERVLGQRAVQLGVEVRRGIEVCGFDADDSGVTVHLANGGDVRAAWLVGCDGGRSQVRRLAGFEFPGTDPEIIGRQGVFTVKGAEQLKSGWQYTPTGLYVSGPKPGRLRTIEFDSSPAGRSEATRGFDPAGRSEATRGFDPADRDAPVTEAEMEDSVRRVSGVDVRITDIVSAARFTDNARQATTYRRGRVLLCGDAAHVHSPFSGQGMNLGFGDAVNLGWKLAATVQGWAPEGLLDTYTSERHSVGAAILDWTRAQVAVMRGDAASSALRSVLTDFFGTSDGATYYVKRASGLWPRYDLGETDSHPLVGSMMPKIQFDDGTWLADHAHTGRTLLVDLAGDERLSALARPYAGRVELIRGGADGSGLSGLLVRPDGFVAWASADGAGDLTVLKAAVTQWLGDGTRVS